MSISKLGAYRGIGSNTRIFNYCCQQTNNQSKCLEKFIKINSNISPIPLPGKMKTVFLLELTAGAVQPVDNNFKKTLEYYWDNYPSEFTRCPIVDTKGLIALNISILNEYYNAGYRYFVGFTFSNILADVLDWFNFHPDATGMTIFGVLTNFSIPKNVYRFLPDDTYRIKPVIPEIQKASKVYYIYQEDLLVGVDVAKILLGVDPSANILAVNLSELTVKNISGFFNDPPEGSILLTLLSSIREDYIALYSNGLTFLGQQYDLLAANLPIIPPGIATIKLNNRYNALTFNGINSSILWRNGYTTLGEKIYITTALNVLQLLSQFSQNNLVDNISSHSGILQFDPVTKDTLYPNILLQKFVNVSFIPTYLYMTDPFLGTYYAYFNTSNSN